MGLSGNRPQGLANSSCDAVLDHCGLRRIARAALFASALLAVQALAAEPARPFDAAEDCSEFSQAGIRDCMAKKAADSAATLKKAEAKASGAISRWDENAKYVKVARARLRESNAAFASYRRAQCALADALIGGGIGNSHEIRRLACVTDLNARRAMELERDTGTLPRR
ncbi:DUF1311 domain-containing protein [Massilia antarctica]|uniref:DUF1311 domain-containing protein n=1 Tax=Massilia antarctica TaxID=2765360 RepID=A0AA48WCD8_9BURK|nr:lysozyme inhibitor LprI family protein [Massilia antarctica]QPI49371.1 DUF1311 domain-containing protein [Massilia antarctica]